jgi:hypothetical protein
MMCQIHRQKNQKTCFVGCTTIWNCGAQTPERQDQAIVIIRNGLVNHNSVADAEINLSATID